jgi:hypothetical protein
MIHQFIFAGPKPGLSAEAFQSYWVNFHAVDYAARIPQIVQYLVATRLPVSTGRDVPFFEGAAEIWLRNDAEQIASMQNPEFLQGARADEPRWAAFWQTLGLDTDPQVLRDDTGPEPQSLAKLYLLMKRPPEMQLAAFQEALLGARKATNSLPAGLIRHVVGFARPGLYGLGEPRFDAVEALSFRDAGTLATAVAQGTFAADLRRGWPFADPRYLFTFAAQEHWVIRPGER